MGLLSISIYSQLHLLVINNKIQTYFILEFLFRCYLYPEPHCWTGGNPDISSINFLVFLKKILSTLFAYSTSRKKYKMHTSILNI